MAPSEHVGFGWLDVDRSNGDQDSKLVDLEAGQKSFGELGSVIQSAVQLVVQTDANCRARTEENGAPVSSCAKPQYAGGQGVRRMRPNTSGKVEMQVSSCEGATRKRTRKRFP